MVGFSWWWCRKFAKNPRLPSGSSQIEEYGSCKHLTTYLIILKKSLIFVIAVQIRLRDYGVLDFDAGDAWRQPPVDTTWQQVLKLYLTIKLLGTRLEFGSIRLEFVAFS
jgi:hypothetical protein